MSCKITTEVTFATLDGDAQSYKYNRLKLGSGEAKLVFT